MLRKCKPNRTIFGIVRGDNMPPPGINTILVRWIGTRAADRVAETNEHSYNRIWERLLIWDTKATIRTISTAIGYKPGQLLHAQTLVEAEHIKGNDISSINSYTFASDFSGME